jgi:uncharacterized membrane protein YhiD involved in acid resistance
MLQKFKITSYATLLLIGLFVFPSAVRALDRDAEIDELNAQLSSLGAEHAKAIEELKAQVDNTKLDIRSEMQAAVDKATEEKIEIQATLDKAESAKLELQAALDRSELVKLNLQKLRNSRIICEPFVDFLWVEPHRRKLRKWSI